MGESQNGFLNIEYLRELSDHDEEFIHELVTIFMTDMEKRVVQLQLAIENGHREEQKSIAHSIRGAAQNVGALILVEDSQALENHQGCDEDRETCTRHVNELQRKFELTKDYIKSYLAS